MTIRELRQTAEAARQNYETISADATSSACEIRKAKRRANEAHHAWLDAATAKMCGGKFEVNHAAN